MKSRIRLKSLPLRARYSPLVRPAQSDVAAFGAAHFPHSFNTRRQGQALLLAVLIMLLAALLSAGFLAVVSGNLNQTARIADKTKAIEASRAGIAFANEQLSGSTQGDLWRPVDVSPAPPPGAASYDFYYSQLDKAQGWANQLPVNDASYRNAAFAKFPAPDQPSSDAPKFLVRVQELTTNPAAPGYDANHAGELKITSIGLSDDDPNVFHTSIAYKNGRRKSPWASALRSISNWKFGSSAKNTGVPYATNPQIISAASFPANQVEFAVDATDKPMFSNDDVPFNVVIVKKQGAPSVRGAVVTKVSADGKQLTFARLERTIGADETIQKAAALGIGSTIDLLQTGNPVPYATDLSQPNGVLANGSVWLQGQIQLSNLSKNGTRLTTSGSLAIDATDADKKPVTENTGDIGPTNSGDATSNKIVASSQANFPGNLILTSAAQSDGVKTTDLVNDGWNKIGAQTLGLDYSAARDVQPFTPAQIDSPRNLARYRALTSNPADGIYLDNRDDIERVGAAPMTQAQLVEMLTSPPIAATPPDYGRLGAAALPNATGVSLEQRHLRGWVGPDEFLARGALVELIQAPNDRPRIRVTLDARSDANPDGPDANKTLRDASGKLQMGVYSHVFEWPKKGTILAQGNIRIRGNVNLSNLPAGANAADFPSLTVVSLGNIYIEGSLSVDSVNASGAVIPVLDRKKLMLLARKNVIVNPTRAVIGRTDVATIATNAAAVNFNGTLAAQTLSVADGSLFNKGDYVTIGVGQNRSVRGLITEAPTANSIKVSSKDVFSLMSAASGAVYNVRSPLESRQAGETAASQRLFFSVVDAQNAINRRILAPISTSKAFSSATPNRSKLLFDHLGELQQTVAGQTGLNIKAEDFDATHPRPTGFTATLTNKQPLDANGKLQIDLIQPNVRKSEKILRTYQNFSSPGSKEFNNFTPPAAKPLSQFVLEINDVAEAREMPDAAGFRYTANLTNAALAPLSTHFLAGVGLRYQPGALFTAPTDSLANQRRQDFDTRTQAQGFTVPLATSVEYDLGGTLSNLLTNSQARSTRYIGFNPGAGATDNDDQLTVDSSFYQLKSEIFKSTLDARVFDAPADATELTTLFSTEPPGIVLKRATALSDAATSSLLPDYQVRALKLENINLTDRAIKPVTQAIAINAFVYAQEGSWIVIPGDYFRSSPPVRGISDATGKIIGSYIDYNNSKTIETNEYILRDPNDANSAKIADLNRNGKYDGGEIEAALRFARYNLAPIQFTGAVVENQSAIVADVAAVGSGAPAIVTGAVQDWTDKWTTYDDTKVANSEAGKPAQFSFISYAFDPSLAVDSAGAGQLRVPVTDELIYQE